MKMQQGHRWAEEGRETISAVHRGPADELVPSMARTVAVNHDPAGVVETTPDLPFVLVQLGASNQPGNRIALRQSPRHGFRGTVSGTDRLHKLQSALLQTRVRTQC